MKDYQKQFINFLVSSGALTFGDFVTKSGRKTPYFVNTGNFNTGEKISEIGKYYASHVIASGLGNVDVIFGPAYKGVPLSVSTVTALFQDHKKNVGFSFNRKESKDHGDGGSLVGTKLSAGMKVVIVEDVITAGTTVREVVPLIHSFGDISILGIVISVDRAERGTGALSAVAEAEKDQGVKVFPIVNIHQIVEYLSSANSSGFVLTSDLKGRIASYLEEYGAKQ